MTTTPGLYLPKDFIETPDGLCFAVVGLHTEQHQCKETVLCFLRYHRVMSQHSWHWQKVDTGQANRLIAAKYPQYGYYSACLDTRLHGVAIDNITCHHQPRIRLQALLSQCRQTDVLNDLAYLCQLLTQQGLPLSHFGVTGSILIDAQQATSDIDLVCYNRTTFQQTRAVCSKLSQSGSLQSLREQDWLESYRRRSCSLSEHEYYWHEQRKFNKGLVNGRKFDLSFVNPHYQAIPESYQKLGTINLQCRIAGDLYAYDYPAEFKIDHPQIESIVCFTATYAGQAKTGEIVEVAGLLEQSSSGIQRIVVGSSREAEGEYIKVIK